MNKKIVVVSKAEAQTPLKPGQLRLDVTSSNPKHGKVLSPFFLGPVNLYKGERSLTVENAWQYAKVYKGFLEQDQTVGERYFSWARRGWANPQANRYPAGKGAKPLYSLWEGQKLPYLEARRVIYWPLYRDAAYAAGGYDLVMDHLSRCDELLLVDFDGYRHEAQGLTYWDVLNDPSKSLGHAFVLAAMARYGPSVTPEELAQQCGANSEAISPTKPPPEPSQGALF